MGFLRRLTSVALGLAAGATAFHLMQKYNKENQIVEGQYVDVTEKAAPQEEPVHYPRRPDHGPNPNPVDLGTAEKPPVVDGRVDPTKIADAKDFADWDELGCQS